MPNISPSRGGSQIDPDTAEVIDLLKGSIVGRHDPDFELASMLPSLESADDEAELLRVLQRLIQDADTD